MKRSVIFIIAIIITLSLSFSLLSGCAHNIIGDNGGNPSIGDDGKKPDDENNTDDEKDYSINLYVNNVEISKLNGDAENKIFTITVTLNEGDIVKFLDSDIHQIINYEKPDEFCGTAKIKGEYTFTITLEVDGELISVVVPESGNNTDDEKDYSISLYVNNVEISKLNGDAENKIFTITVTLNEGDIVKFLDSNIHQIINYEKPDEFCGTVKINGEYMFTIKLKEGVALISVVIPEVDPKPIIPDPIPDGTHTVYYSNSNHWSEVYAYVWNSKTNLPKKAWPGEKLSSIGTSEFGEKQYSFTADTVLYDRIIFNDGKGQQTKDLVFSFASSGFYGVDGLFTMNKDNYGKVEYFSLKDDKNLSYTNTKSKKFSVYTPSDYSKDKKYAVLYMFDSQNLYIGADGREQNKDGYGSWAVDVAVNNLVANNRNGFIIVAIDNTDGYRDSELTMSRDFGTLTSLADNNAFFNGKLDMLGDFMVETLMPWINSHYSVYGTRENTGIAGSSSGGLAAYYLGLRDKHLYGYIGAFSPANGLFTSSDWNRFYAKQNFATERPLIYAYCGKGDSLENMLMPATKEIMNLTKYGYSSLEITENYVTSGTHSEDFWRVAFVEFAGLFSAFCDK